MVLEGDRRINLYLMVVGFLGIVIFALPFLALFLRIEYGQMLIILRYPEVKASIVLSMITALVATAIALFLGLGLAYVLAFWEFPFKAALDTFSTLPMVLPPSAAGYILLLAFGKFGLLGRPIYRLFGVSILFSTYAIILAQVFVITPFVIGAAKSAFLDINPNYIRAAATLGADQLTIVKEIILPLSKKGILAGTIMAFARAIGEFGASVMVAGLLQTMPIAIFNMAMRGTRDEANIIAFILILISFTMLFIFRHYMGERR
ncbi:MAG: ABC transporter permease subunit [Methanobacteriota archaeon]|nr:MAG: ABC transporter permease subunit [Euryarchaeota archaeon]